jgi:hypothetical protein
LVTAELFQPVDLGRIGIFVEVCGFLPVQAAHKSPRCHVIVKRGETSMSNFLKAAAIAALLAGGASVAIAQSPTTTAPQNSSSMSKNTTTPAPGNNPTGMTKEEESRGMHAAAPLLV